MNEIQSKYDINKKTRTDKIIKINLPEFKKKISAILKKHIPNKDIKKILLNYLLEAEMKGVKADFYKLGESLSQLLIDQGAKTLLSSL